MGRIKKMRPLAFKLFPLEFLEKSGVLLKIVKNLNFSTWKKVFSNFGLSVLRKLPKITKYTYNWNKEPLPLFQV